jgi:hypothetical protein
MPTVKFKLLQCLSEASAGLGHNLKHHSTDSVVQYNAWDPSVLIIACRCFKSSKRSVNTFVICLGSELRIKFGFYRDCTYKGSKFCSYLNIPQHKSLIPVCSWWDYERGCLEIGYLFRVTWRHTWYLKACWQNEWRKTFPQAVYLQQLKPFKPNLATVRTNCSNVKELLLFVAEIFTQDFGEETWGKETIQNNLGVNWRIILKWMWRPGLGCCDSGWGQVAGYCECGNEPYGYTKCGECLD